MARQHTEQPIAREAPGLDLEEVFYDPQVWLLGFVLLFLYILSKWNKKPESGILARGKLGGIREKNEAQKKGIKRIEKRKHNEVCLWVKNPATLEFSVNSLFMEPDKNTLYFPNCESGILALGDNGSGKSFSFLQPMAMSGLMQGFPMAFFDIKYSSHKVDDPAPCAQIGGLGIKVGYDVQIFAPGLPESCRLNPVELIRSTVDTEMAMQLAKVLYRNVIGKIESGNQFFTTGAIAGIAGYALVAKLTPYPDFLTIRELSNLEVDDFKRLLESPLIPESTKMVFDVLKQASDDAFGDLKATISSVLSQILMPVVIPSITGRSNVSLDLDERQLLIFGADGERRDVVCPIIATVIHLITNRNLLKARKNPYLLWLDELPAIYLPEVDQWPNQFRSAGLVLAVGTQSPEMLEAKYGKDGTQRILKGLNTQGIFQLGSPKDCKTYSEAVGKEDVNYKSRGKSMSQRVTNNLNDQKSTRPIIEPDEIGQFPQGKAIIFSRGNMNDKRVRVPLIEQIEIPESDLDLITECQQIWEVHLAELKSRQSLQPIDNKAFQVRRDAIQCFLKNTEELKKTSDTARSILSVEDRLGIDEPLRQRRMVA